MLLGMAGAPPSFAAPPDGPAVRHTAGYDAGLAAPTAIRDIVLSRGGMLSGSADSTGRGAAERRQVTLFGDSRGFRAVYLDRDGRFAFGPLHGGVYTIVSDNGAVVVRAWERGTEPPSAIDSVAIGQGDLARLVARGQSPVGEFFASDRFLLVATIAGAIAIPIAIHSNRHDDTPSGS